MTLRLYVRPRMVVLGPGAPVLEAARAIEHNHIGAVVVQDAGRVVGIVTDRDLAARVVGQGLDPKTTMLGDVMTRDVATLSPTDSQADAIRLMYRRKVRRIPLVDGERPVGIVTLDDLLLDEAAPIEHLAAIVQSQLGIGGPAPAIRARGRRRNATRADATYARLLARLWSHADRQDAGQAEDALGIVLASLVRRLTPAEADDLIAQLPKLLQPRLLAQPRGPDRAITRAAIEREIAQRLDVEPERATRLLRAVGAALAGSVSAGEMEDMRGQLPMDLRAVFVRR